MLSILLLVYPFDQLMKFIVEPFVHLNKLLSLFKPNEILSTILLVLKRDSKMKSCSSFERTVRIFERLSAYKQCFFASLKVTNFSLSKILNNFSYLCSSQSLFYESKHRILCKKSKKAN
jgi:hypothetical protein